MVCVHTAIVITYAINMKNWVVPHLMSHFVMPGLGSRLQVAPIRYFYGSLAASGSAEVQCMKGLRFRDNRSRK